MVVLYTTKYEKIFKSLPHQTGPKVDGMAQNLSLNIQYIQWEQ